MPQPLSASFFVILNLDAAAAAADPFHSGIRFLEPFVVAIGRLVVVDKGETG